VRTVSGSVGYASTSDLTVHFGLGAEKEAKIEVRWPSGKTQVMLNVPADQKIAVTEALADPKAR
jgi:enediyne biosynthesis protein E4